MANYATEHLAGRLKAAVYVDLPEAPKYRVGQDIMADRARSAQFKLHEDKHVVGTQGPGYVAFPDAAAHAGLAHYAQTAGENFYGALPSDVKKYIQPATFNQLQKPTSGPSHAYRNERFPMVGGGALALGRQTVSNRIVTIHTRPGVDLAAKPFDRPLYIHPALAEFSRQWAKDRIPAEAYSQLSKIVPNPILPPATVPRRQAWKK